MNSNKPNLIPLITISIIDGILALITILPFLLLSDAKELNQNTKLFCYGLLFLGDILAVGYILTLITKRFSVAFWGLSAFVNIPLFFLYLVGIFNGLFILLPLVFWCGFVSGPSIYYLKFGLDKHFPPKLS